MTNRVGLKKSVYAILIVCLTFSGLVVPDRQAVYADEASGALLITEIMYDPPGSDNGAEYVEITNFGDEALEIGGYYIGDSATQGNSEGMFRFPADTVIAAGQSFVIAQSALITEERYGFVPDFELPQHTTYNPKLNPGVPTMLNTDWSTGYLSLAQGGDDVLLMDGDRQVVDYVTYITPRTLNGKSYNPAPGMTQHIQSLQRQYATGDASIDFWPLKPTPQAAELKSDAPHPYPGPAIGNALLITEVLYDALGDEDTGEYIEIANVGDLAIDIGGYSIGDAEFPRFTSSGEGMYKFPEGTIIKPNQVMVIAANAQGIKDRYDVTPDFELDSSMPDVPKLEQNAAWATGMIRLANDGDQALLYDRDMNIVDAVVWNDSAPFPGVAPYMPPAGGMNGHSIERLSAVDTNDCAIDFVDQPNPTPGKTPFGQPVEETEQSLLITEIMYDAPGNDNGAEYVEITNFGNQDRDIGGYHIGDSATKGNSEGMYQFPEGTVIKAGQSIVIAQSALITEERYGFVPDFELPYHETYNPKTSPNVPPMLDTDWSTGYLSLANGGDDILLMDQDRQMLDYVTYITSRSFNGKRYEPAPGIAQHVQSLQRRYATGDPSVDFWPLKPTPRYAELAADTPHPHPGPAISTTLLITEVLYDAIHDEDTGEFIEITNITDETIDISGYSIGDAEFPRFTSSGEGMFKFPEGTFIEPYQVMVIAGHAQGMMDRYQVLADFELDQSMDEVPTLEPNTDWATGMMRLGNNGDQALLYDRDMNIIDAVVWRDASPFPGVIPFQPTIYSNNGHSIERLTSMDTNNVEIDFVAQPDPSPGVLLFGPHADLSRIPDRTMRDDVLVPGEPTTGIQLPPTVVADGGDSVNAPENTVAAIERLLLTDASQIWLPVQLTSDGELIVMRDATLDRTTDGSGAVSDKAWSDIQLLDAGSWFAPEYAEERVPLLSDALNLIQGKLIPVIQTETMDAARKTVELLQDRKATDALIVSSNEQIIGAVRDWNPELRGGLLLADLSLDKQRLAEVVLSARNSGASIVMLKRESLTDEIIHHLRIRGITVWGMGADDEIAAHDLIALGAGGIVTVNPQSAIHALGQYPDHTITQRPIIGGHRGTMTEAPENTLPAFEAAWLSGADLIETDILETKDGHLILMHDDNVDRTTDGTGKVRDLTLAELKRLNANYMDPSRPVEVPTLTELLEWASEKKKTREIALFLEIKQSNLEEKILNLVKQYELEDDVFLITFRKNELLKVRQLNKDVGLVYIHNGLTPTENPYGHAEKFLREAVIANVHYNPSNPVTPELLKFANHRGLVTFTWPISTVSDNPAQYAHDPITAETPEELVLGIGETALFQGEVRNQDGEARSLTLQVRTLEDSAELVHINESKGELTALAEGTVWVQGYYRYPFKGEEWTLFARPTKLIIGDLLKIAIQEAIAAIDRLPSAIALADKASVESARAKVDEAIAKGAADEDISNLAKLVAAEAEIARLERQNQGGNYPVILPPVDIKKQVVTADQLVPQQGTITINMKEQANELHLPANLVGSLSGETLQIERDGALFKLSASLLKDMLNKLDSGNLSVSYLVFSIAILNAEQAKSMSDRIQREEYAAIRLAGDIAALELNLLLPSGEKIPYEEFKVPVEIQMEIGEHADGHLLGIYVIGNDGKLEFVGGRREGSRLGAAANHSGLYGILEYNKRYSDVPADHWAAEAIQALSAKHVLQGVTEAEFRPASTLTRAQFVTMLVRAFGLSDGSSDGTGFNDVSANAWYAEAVAAAVASGVVNGVSADRFAPNAFITREQMAVMLVRAYEKVHGQLQLAGGQLAFSDASEISEWAERSIQIAVELGWMQGKSPSKLDPANTATRAESAMMIYPMMQSEYR